MVLKLDLDGTVHTVTILARRPHLVFLDIWMQGSRLDGLQLLQVIKEQHPNLPVGHPLRPHWLYRIERDS